MFEYTVEKIKSFNLQYSKVHLFSGGICIVCTAGILMFLACLNRSDRTAIKPPTAIVSFDTIEKEDVAQPEPVEEHIETPADTHRDPLDLPAPPMPAVSVAAPEFKSSASPLLSTNVPATEFPQYTAITSIESLSDLVPSKHNFLPPGRGLNQGPVMITPPNLKMFYPRRAQRKGIEGTTRFRLIIDSSGKVTEVEILDSRPENIFEEAARRLARSLRFRPALREERPVPCRVQTRIDWKLE